jgi:hypothetical protein
VQEVEVEIQARKGEVERLIQDMKSANLESLTISPPEETRAFLDGTISSCIHNTSTGTTHEIYVLDFGFEKKILFSLKNVQKLK